ncbi:MAG: hypothetical protein FJZ75_10460 [Bacteroidetes bacterium]|jgi:hypothetical protein|nr:hypothetical protein [Bacteroidota bacterium]
MKTAGFFLGGLALQWILAQFLPFGYMSMVLALLWAFIWNPSHWQQLLGSFLATGMAWVLSMPLLQQSRAFLFFEQLEQIISGRSFSGYGWVGITFLLGAMYGVLGGWLGSRTRALFWYEKKKSRGLNHPLIRR